MPTTNLPNETMKVTQEATSTPAAPAEDTEMKGAAAEADVSSEVESSKRKRDESESEEKATQTSEEKPRRKQKKPKKVKLDENGQPIPKKKRKLNHQCAAVKICHREMKEFRDALPEEEQDFIAKFCQLNRGAQGVMFNNMCVTMREYLKEKYPGLEKWEDMDYIDEEQKPKYTEKIRKFLLDYMDERRKESKETKAEPASDEATSDDK